MKKLITILTIMIVFAGMVFAVDGAYIDVTATIAEHVPTIKLAITSATSVVAFAEDTVAADIAHAGPAALHADTVNNLTSGTEQTVSFKIYQYDYARLSVNGTNNHIYNYTVSATDLILQVNDADVVGPTGAQKFNCSTKTPTVNALQTGATASANYTNNGNTTATAVGGAGSLTVTYKGYVPADAILGEFDISWDGNTSAEAGTYKSTITMTVTTE